MHLLFRTTCVLLLLLHGRLTELNGQSNLKKNVLPAFTLRFNPLSFMERDGNVMLGLGYQWHPRWAATFDPGYIFYRPYILGENNRPSSLSGIKIRSDIRFFFDKSRSGGFNTFIAPEFHYKYAATKKWDDFGINCLGGQCDYYQKAQYKEVKKETGGSLKLGTVLPLWSSRWSAEIYGGIGFKFKKFRYTDLPLGGTFVNEPDQDNVFNNADENKALPMVPAGVKIIFRIF